MYNITYLDVLAELSPRALDNEVRQQSSAALGTARATVNPKCLLRNTPRELRSKP